MRIDEWLLKIRDEIDAGRFALSQLPLGLDEQGEVVLSHAQNRQDRYFHTCVTGGKRTRFIMDTVCSLAMAYGEGKATFLILSDKSEYVRLLSLKGADITVPYLRSEQDFQTLTALAERTAKDRKENPAYPRFFLVMDGLDGLQFLKKDDSLSIERALLERVAGGAEVLSGVDFSDSIFSGFPGAFVGVGNSLVSADGRGIADVTFVNADCSLGCPKPIAYPVHDREGKD